MLRRLRKKLELIEIWGWCPRPTKENLKGAEIPFSDDSWSKVDTICFRLQFYRSLRSLDRFGWFLVHFEASRSYFQLFGPFPRRSYVDFQISGVDLWLFLIMIINFKWLYLFATGHRTLCVTFITKFQHSPNLVITSNDFSVTWSEVARHEPRIDSMSYPDCMSLLI